MIKDLFLLSVNSMKRRKLRSWLTLLGIFIGIAAVVSLISLGQGLQSAIEGQFGALSPDTLTVQNAGTGFGPPGSTVVVKLTSHDLKLIQGVRGVKITSGRFVRIAKVEYNKNIAFNYLVNVPTDKKEIDFIYKNGNFEAEEGRLLTDKDVGKIVVGSDYVVDDKIFGKSVRLGAILNIQGKDFQVIGILKKTNSFIFNGMIMMPEKDMKNLLNIGDELDAIAVKVDSIGNVQNTATNIQNVLRKDRKEKIGEEDFSVQTPQQSLAAVKTILNIINLIVIGIASISLLIGGIGIANTMYSSILERTKEIGTMKAIGAKNSNIMTLFVFESGLFGLIGGILGAMFGILLAYTVSTGANNYFGQTILTFNLNYMLLISAILFSFFIGVLAGLIPSYQASRMRPVDALRQ